MGLQANKEQEQVIQKIDGPLLVVACPGSGKTTTMIRRIRHMIESGIPENSILMVTFTRDAAISMRNKYKELYGEKPGCTFQTLHAMCMHLLRDEGRYHQGDLLESEEQILHMYQTVSEAGADGDLWDLSQKILGEISVVKNSYSDISSYEAKTCDTEFFLNAFQDYEDWKASMHRYDFDDLMVKCLDMLRDCRHIRKKWQDHYRYILCDEYQDTNSLQRDILYFLTGDRGNICVVGDDDQSIYGFRGARPEVMTEFTEHFKNAAVIKLTTNYRSCQAVVDAADDLIKYNTGRFDKQFISFRGMNGEDGKAEYIRKQNRTEEFEDMMRRIRELYRDGVPYKDMAILVRTNKQISAPVSELSKGDIPFYTTERVTSVYSGWMFRDLKAYADLSMGTGNIQDIRLVLNHPKRYLDETRFRVKEFSYPEFRRGLGYLSDAEYWKYEDANKKIRIWMNALGPGKITPDTPTADFFDALEMIRYRNYLLEYAQFRKEDVTDYEEIYEGLKSDALSHKTVSEWFSYAAYQVRKVEEEMKKKDKNGVRVATMHGSKGLEWQHVFILDCNEKIVPHKNSFDDPEAIAEERRLLYVAITRAKDTVTIYNSSPFESRFMKQIRDGLSVNGSKRIPKYLPGKEVFHKRFGHGTLLGYEEGKICIRFDNGRETKLEFPGAFLKGFMKYI